MKAFILSTIAVVLFMFFLMNPNLGADVWHSSPGGAFGPSGGGGWTDDGTTVRLTTSTDNVGVGTATVGAKLDVWGNGTTSATNALTIKSSAGTSRVIVQDGGNVGIGTSSIGQVLSVGGLVGSGAGSAALPAYTTTGDSDTGVWFPTANTIAASVGGAEVFRLDSSKNMTIGANDGTTHSFTLKGGGAGQMTVSFASGTGSFDIPYLADNSSRTGFGLTFAHQNFSGSVDTYLVDSSLTTYDTGSGSTATAIQGRTTYGNTSGTLGRIYGVYGRNVMNGSGGTVTDSWGIYGSTAGVTAGTLTRNWAAGFNGPVEFATNVGIGTTGIVPGGRLIVIGAGTTTGIGFQTKDLSQTEKVTILDSGNVGIGSSSPEGALNIRLSTSNIGWSVVAGANTACDTTCSSSCVMGFASAVTGSDPVSCTDATADNCLCAGSN